MSNNLNLTPDIETKLRNKLDSVTNDRSIYVYKNDLMHCRFVNDFVHDR